MSEFGPLATTVADLGLALDVLAGGDAYRAVAPPDRPLRVGAYRGKGLVRTLLGLTAYMPFPPPLNLVGFPAMSVSAGGLPLGVQLAAAPGGEALLLSVASQLETLRPWPRHAPLEPVATI